MAQGEAKGSKCSGILFSDDRINRLQGHYYYYEPCSLIYNTMFYKKLGAMSWKNSSLSGALKLNRHYTMSKRDTLWSSAWHCQGLHLALGGLQSRGLENPQKHHSEGSRLQL